MESRRIQYILVILIGVGLCVLLFKSSETFHNSDWGGWDPADTPSWKGRGPDALPWGGWDQLVLPNPLRQIQFPPANGGKDWQEPLLLAYGGSPTLNCNDQRRTTC